MKTAKNTRLPLIFMALALAALFAASFGNMLGNKAAPFEKNAAQTGNSGMENAGRSEGEALPRRMTQEAQKKLAALMAEYQKDTKNIKSIIELGEFFSQMKEWPEAAGFFQKAVEVDPKNVNAHYWLAMSQYNMGNVDKAISGFETLLDIQKNPRAMFNLALLYKHGKNDMVKGNALLEELIALPGTDEDLRAMAKQELEAAN